MRTVAPEQIVMAVAGCRGVLSRAMLGRRGFLGALARAGSGALIAAAVPEWARAASRLETAPGARAGRAAADADLIVRNTWPEHYETSIAALGRAWVTPTEAFFVRSH